MLQELSIVTGQQSDRSLIIVIVICCQSFISLSLIREVEPLKVLGSVLIVMVFEEKKFKVNILFWLISQSWRISYHPSWLAVTFTSPVHITVTVCYDCTAVHIYRTVTIDGSDDTFCSVRWAVVTIVTTALVNTGITVTVV